MEPFTHALTALAILSRAGAKRLPRFGTAMLVVSGLAADLDYASYIGGPGVFLRFHSAALHSLAGSALLTCGLAAGFCAVAGKIDADRLRRNTPSKSAPPLPFRSAVAVCAAGVASHLLLDLASGDGVGLLWPFRRHWTAFDLAASLDPWILALLIAGLLLPQLFRLVNEEVGARNKHTGGTGAIVTLGRFSSFIWVRGRTCIVARSMNWNQATTTDANLWKREPFRTNPILSIGVEWWTPDTTIEELDVPLGPGENFDSDHSLTQYKPDGFSGFGRGAKKRRMRKYFCLMRDSLSRA